MNHSQAEGEDHEREGRSVKLALSLSPAAGGGDVDSDLKKIVHRRRPRRGSEDGVYECKTCRRKFPSFQALGGHRTSHLRPAIAGWPPLRRWNLKPSVHKCPICGLGFAMGQALGGHMRRHRSTAGGGAGAADVGDGMIDTMSTLNPIGLADESSVNRMIRNRSCHDLVLLELFK